MSQQKIPIYLILITLLTLFMNANIGCSKNETASSVQSINKEVRISIALPEPKYDSNYSIEKSLKKRRSIREYSEEQIKVEEVSQILWAAQGITSKQKGRRSAPSAGALYPLEVYVAAGNVANLLSGIYHYNPENHELSLKIETDQRSQLSRAALGQSPVRNGAIDIIITGIYEKTTRRYKARGIQFVHMEAGHAAQNVCLQGTALGLGVVTIGAFDEDMVSKILNLPKDEVPLYIIPVGKVP